MRVLLSTYDSPGASNRWWDSPCGCGNSARRCWCGAPPDCAERLAEVGVPLGARSGAPVRPLVHGATGDLKPTTATGSNVRRSVARHGHQVRHAGPVPIACAQWLASDLRTELNAVSPLNYQRV